MPSFGKASQQNLSTCHADLQRLFNEVIKHWDCAVIIGHRGESDQNKAFVAGKSKLQWPNGEHNALPSKAADVVPCPVDWNDLNRFYMFVGFVRGVAASMGIKIRCGADWDGDGQVKDQNFNDIDHFELLD